MRVAKPLSLLPPPSSTKMSTHPFITIFSDLASHIQLWVNNGWDPQQILSLTAQHLSMSQVMLCNCSVLQVLSLENDSPTAPPSAPSHSEEFWLLCKSFNSAFTSLSGQVKELAAKVNSSRPPPKAAAAKKPSAQPPTKPCAQPPAAPAPTPASHPAPPSFAFMAKAPAWPSLVVALCPSTPGADVPLAICQSPQEVVTHLNAKLTDAHPHND